MSKFQKRMYHYSRKLWNRYPKVRGPLLDFILRIHYKKWTLSEIPSTITLANGNVLCIDLHENRGKTLLFYHGVTQPKLRFFWKEAVNRLQPTVVVDVGVNYGECIFSENYSSQAKIYGIEANPGLFPFIDQSLAHHHNQAQIHIIQAFASDQNDQVQPFYINHNWSGESSAAPPTMHNEIDIVTIPTLTIDSLFEDAHLDKELLLFKVDVEGYEPKALQGMRKLFTTCQASIGIIEFHSDHLTSAGVDIDAFLSFLSHYFSIYIAQKFGHLQKCQEASLAWFQQYGQRSLITLDLILTTDEQLIAKLPYTISN